MHTTDAIADMLTRIRNAGSAKHESVDIPASNLKRSIAKILLDEGYIKDLKEISDNKQDIIRITLKYTDNKKNVISGLKRISKPGLRVYAGKDELPKVLGGLGIAIISTSKGIMTDKKPELKVLEEKYWLLFGNEGGKKDAKIREIFVITRSLHKPHSEKGR